MSLVDCSHLVIITSNNLAPVVLDPELKLGCVEGNLQMKVLTKFNVNQLLLWNSLWGFGKKAFHSTV